MPKISLFAFSFPFRDSRHPDGGAAVIRSRRLLLEEVADLCARSLLFAASLGVLFALMCVALRLLT